MMLCLTHSFFFDTWAVHLSHPVVFCTCWLQNQACMQSTYCSHHPPPSLIAEIVNTLGNFKSLASHNYNILTNCFSISTVMNGDNSWQISTYQQSGCIITAPESPLPSNNVSKLQICRYIKSWKKQIQPIWVKISIEYLAWKPLSW